MWSCEVPGSILRRGDLFSSRILITWQHLHLVICKMDHCTILQKRQFVRTKKHRLNPVSLLPSICIWRLAKWITAHFSRRKLNPVSLLRSVYILWLVKLIPAQFYKRQFLTTKNSKTKSSVCIWWFVKLITAQFYKRDNFSRRKLNPVSLLCSVCIWCLVKLIAAQFYNKRQFLTTKNMTTKSSVCIWRLVKLIAAQFYKKDNFSQRRKITLSLA